MNQPPEVINEADKPFFLLIGLTVVWLVIFIYAVHEGTDTYAEVKDVIGSVFALLAAGYGFYFRGKV